MPCSIDTLQGLEIEEVSMDGMQDQKVHKQE